MNFIAKFKLLPVKTKKLLGLGITIALVVALPLFIWGVTTQQFDIRKRASSGEPIPAQECETCGGITGIKCAEGLKCEYYRNYLQEEESSAAVDLKGTPAEDEGKTKIYPDETGICVLLSGRSNCPITPTPTPVGLCSACGGLSGIRCTSGLVCSTDNQIQQYPNQMGVCIPPNSSPTICEGTVIPTITAKCNTSCNYSINPPVGCASGLSCTGVTMPGQSGVCRNLSCPDDTDCVCSAPISKCNETCGGMPGPIGTTRPTCESGLYCKTCTTANCPTDQPGVCRNSSCPDKTDCKCSETLHQNFIFKIKLSGVADDQAEGAKMQVRFKNKSISIDKATVATLHHAGNGVYEASFGFESNTSSPVLPSVTGYTIFLKAEKHIAKKICTYTQTERCTGDGNILINSGNLYEVKPGGTPIPSPQIFDITALPLEPGDLPAQDGVANGADFTKIKALLTKSCSELTAQEKYTADLDYNGCINIRDAFLMRKTLETKYDEE
jgi:hypothetical protein